VGRAQEVALILRAARSTGELPPVPIHLDGMVRGVCDLYQAQVHDLNPRLQNYVRNARRPLFADPSLAVYAVTAGRRRQLLNDPGAAVVISSSGMMTGGPAPLYARAFAADEKNAIVFSGYQDDESPWAALLRARQGTTVALGKEELTLSCAVERYSLSAHADAGQIEVAVTRARPRTMVLVHGEPDTLRAEERRAEDARLQARVGGPQDPAHADDFSRPGQGAALIDAHGLAAEYQRHAERLIARYPLADMSRLDYTVLRDLAKRHPHANAHDLAQAIREGSPNVHERKTNDRWLDRYVEKTVTAVNLDPQVREARQKHERQRGGSRGR